MRGPRTVMKSGPHLPQLEKALAQKRRPNTAIKKERKEGREGGREEGRKEGRKERKKRKKERIYQGTKLITSLCHQLLYS